MPKKLILETEKTVQQTMGDLRKLFRKEKARNGKTRIQEKSLLRIPR